MAAAPTPAAQALLGALADHPGATASELAVAGIGRSTASKLLATLATDGQVLRQPGGPKGGRRAADRWTLPTPTPTNQPGAPSPATPPAAAAGPTTGSGRLRPGALRDLVLASQGAVTQTQAKPRRYAVAHGGSGHADTAS